MGVHESATDTTPSVDVGVPPVFGVGGVPPVFGVGGVTVGVGGVIDGVGGVIDG
jgi:hypothetical protein